jgi:hypothetical protein
MPAALILDTVTTRDLAPARESRSPASLVAHLVDAFRAWRQEALEHEIGSFIESRGGRITDDLERQISHRLG